MCKIFENKIVINIESKKLGLMEKWLRLNSNLTIEQAAKCLNVSKGNLSEVENGKRGLKNEVFSRFIDRFYPNFDYNWSLPEEAEIKLDELFHAFAYWDSSEEDQIEKWVTENRNRLLNSFACMYLIIFETYFSYRKSLDWNDVEVLNSSEVFLQYFSPDIRSFLLFNKGYMYLENRTGIDPKKSALVIEIFEAALKEMDGRRWPQLEGIIRQNLAGAASQDISFQHAVNIIERAESIFIREFNFLRLAAASNNKAVYFSYLGQNEKAIEIIDKLILNKNTFSDQKFHYLALSNKALFLTLGGYFDEAVKFIQDHKHEMNPKYPRNFILEPYCLLRISDEKACLMAIKSYQNCSLSEDDELFYALIKAMISQNSDRVEKAKKKMFTVCRYMKNWGMMFVMLQALAYFYKQTCQSDRLAEVYEWQAMLHKHQIPEINEL